MAASRLPEQIRGTFAGVVEKIPYLKRLRITGVELMPVFQFDPADQTLARWEDADYERRGFACDSARWHGTRDVDASLCCGVVVVERTRRQRPDSSKREREVETRVFAGGLYERVES